MTVTSEGAPPCVAPCRSRYGGPEPPLPGREGAGYVDVWRAAYAPRHESAQRTEDQAWGSSHHVVEHRAHVERWWHLDEWRAEWRSGLRFLRWEHLDPERVAVELLGDTPAHIRIEGGEMHVYGPWRMTIRSFEGESGRRVLSTWSMRWVRASTPLIERWHRVLERRVVSSWEREQLGLGGSEAHGLRERGASERLRLGGSERMRVGASEWVAAGGSETAWLGGSERQGVAASWRLGASEWLGGSERSGASTLERWGGRLEGSDGR
jgi:hypothetical protein